MIKKVVVRGREGEVRRHRAGRGRSATTVLVALGLVLSQAYAAGGHPRTKKPRVTLRDIRVPYELGTGGVGIWAGEIAEPAGIPVEVGPKERFMAFNVIDWTGRPVRVSITTHAGDSMGGAFRFCESTNGFPIAVPSGKTIYFWLRTGTCNSGAPAVATHGWIDVTFGNRWFSLHEKRAQP